ncbi:MAG: hypothetical protein DRJ98_02665 [Thermoprotei archaeon]|nr:MAG: hypothetical protein DRJ98_02665 [Thermoprotei archaeon]
MLAARKIEMDEDWLKALVKEASTSPQEVCGFLLGSVEGETVKVLRVYPSVNVAPSPTRFVVRPEDIYEAHVKAEKLGLEVVGIYHSHPAPPNPSDADLEGMKKWPIIWLIVSSLDGSVKAYIFRGATAVELELVSKRRI